MGQAHVLDDRAGSFQGTDGFADPALEIGIHAGQEVLAREAQALALERAGRLVVVGQVQELVGDGHGRRGRVALVAAGHRVEQRGRVPCIARERADLVERARECHDPVARHAPVRGLHAHDPAERRRLADRAAGVRADAERRVIRGDRDRRAATAAAGDRVEVPRVGRRPVGAVLGRRAHRELVHVRLAEDHGSDRAQLFGDVRVVRRDVPLEDPRAGRRLAALDRDEVLERDRDAEERMQGIERGATVATGHSEAGVRRVRLVERAVVEGEPGVQGMVLAALGDLPMGDDEVTRGDIASPQAGEPSHGMEAARDVGAAREIHRSPALLATMIAGTTMKSPSRAGSVRQRLLHTLKDGCTASPRGGCSRARSSGRSAGWPRCRARPAWRTGRGCD